MEPSTNPSAQDGLSTTFRSVARNLGWMLASRGVLAVLSLIYLAVATRTLGVTNFGRFALIIGASQALAAFVGFQTWQIIVQYGTRHLQTGDEDGLAAVLRACALLDACSAILGVMLATVILSIWQDALGVGATLARATLWFTAAQLLSIRSTPLGILRMRDRFSLSAAADSATPVVRLIGAAAAALIHPTVQGFLAAWGAAEVLTAAAYWGALAFTGDLALLGRRRRGLRRLTSDNPGIVRFALTSNAISTLGLSSKQIPLLLTGGTVGTAAAGAFRLAAQLALSLTKLSQLLTRAAFPEIVRAVGTDGLGGLGRLMRRSFLVSTSVAAVAYLVIVLGGRPVLRLMGHGFGDSYPILLWLAAAGCIDLMTVGFEPLLMAAHRASLVAGVRLVGTASLFAVALALAPRIGVTGIAIAVLVNSLIVAALLGWVLALVIRSDRRRALR